MIQIARSRKIKIRIGRLYNKRKGNRRRRRNFVSMEMAAYFNRKKSKEGGRINEKKNRYFNQRR